MQDQARRSAGAEVVAFGDAATKLRELRSEAAALRSVHGENAYSDFVLKHLRRPDRDQAAAIGRLMGVRVRAADGTLQPEPTKAERVAARKSRRQQRVENDYVDQILRFRCALANLAQNNSDPADLIRYMDPLFGDELVIREQIAHAVQWINRFAGELGREQATRGSSG